MGSLVAVSIAGSWVLPRRLVRHPWVYLERSWRCDSGDQAWPLAPSFLLRFPFSASSLPWIEQPSSTLLFCHVVLPQNQKTMDWMHWNHEEINLFFNCQCQACGLSAAKLTKKRVNLKSIKLLVACGLQLHISENVVSISPNNRVCRMKKRIHVWAIWRLFKFKQQIKEVHKIRLRKKFQRKRTTK